MKHSKIGASSAKRLIACPGSLRLSEQAPPQQTSKYAIEGTRAHKVAEYMLMGKPIPAWADEDMIDGAKIYSRTITEVLLSGDIDKSLKLEDRICIRSVSDQAFGTCDAWCIVDGELHVFDYKYGAGVAVSPEWNEQLMYYALGVCESASFGMEADVIHLWIVQPRCGGVSKWTTDWDELIDFQEKLIDAIADANSPNPSFKIGEGCRFCPALAICPLKRAEIESKFDTCLSLDKPPIKKNPSELDATDIVRYIEHAESLQAWLGALKQHLQVMIELGAEVPGWSVETSKSNRSWKEDKIDELVKLYGDVMYDRKLKSPAGLEKVKGVDKKLIAEYTERKDGGRKLVRANSDANTGLFTAFTEEGVL